MQGFPITAQDLEEGYRQVAERIGITGMRDDLSAFHGDYYPLAAPAPLSAPPAKLMGRYSKRKKDRNFQLGHARNAVLTEPNGRRNACVQCGLCLYGCARKSIYNSADELDVLQTYNNFNYLPKTSIKNILGQTDGKQQVEAEKDGQVFTIESCKLLLGAGTVNSTALLLDYLGMHNMPVKMHCNPVAGMAFLLPEYIGLSFSEKSFGLGRLSYRLELEGSNDYAMGVLYGGDTLPLNLFASRMPFSRPASLRLSALLAPAMLMATCYLGSQRSAMNIALKQEGNSSTISITGETRPDTATTLKRAGRKLGRSLARYRAFLVPGSFTVSPPGSDAHLAGTIPMGGTTQLACNTQCELVSMPGLYVIDGAWLPHLPPKHCTFTIMANATRVGIMLSKR
jgi:choline dehydrogenase-like flavoprotein